MADQIMWINVYRSGFFHTKGKPGCPDIHGGDIYPDRDDALKAIDPPSHYLGTVAVVMRPEVVDRIFEGGVAPMPVQHRHEEAWLEAHLEGTQPLEV